MTPVNPDEVAGVDFSTARPAAAVLRDAGFRFVVGYLKPLTAAGPNPMELRPADVAVYRATGLAVAAVWETTATRAQAGASAGLADGQAARLRAVAIGYPTTCVAFAAVDWAVTDAQLPVVGAYLDGFARGWAGPAGGYGSFRLVEWLAANLPALYRWQTAAWSNDAQGRPQLSEHAHLYQRNVKHWPDVPGTDEDVLCAPVPWYGPAAITPPTPAPPTPAPPTPAPGPAFDVLRWTANAGDSGPVFSYLQQWANLTWPAYQSTPIQPLAPHYGPQTVGFLAELAHRAARDPALAAWSSRLAAARGDNIGAGLAHALDHYGFTAYLSRVGFRG